MSVRFAPDPGDHLGRCFPLVALPSALPGGAEYRPDGVRGFPKVAHHSCSKSCLFWCLVLQKSFLNLKLQTRSL
eukprot:1187998-Prorocentrum_minimum.AAC.1